MKLENPNILKEQTITTNVIIDLSETGKEPSGVGKGFCIEVPPMSFEVGWLGKKLSKFVRTVKRMTVSLRVMHIDGNLICDASKAPFTLMYECEANDTAATPDRDKTLKCEVDIDLKEGRTPFQIYFNRDYILDCKARQGEGPDFFPVAAELLLLNDKGATVRREVIVVNVRFKDINIAPTLRVVKDIASKNKFKYEDIHDSNHVRVGELRFSNRPDGRFPNRWPKARMGGRVRLTGPGGEDMTSRLSIETSGRTETAGFDYVDKAVKVDGSCDFRPKAYSVFMDFTGLSNPLGAKDTYTIWAEGEWAYSSDPEMRSPFTPASVSVDLLQDAQGSELRVESNGRKVESGIAEKIELRHQPGSLMGGEINLDLINLATDTSRKNAGVAILGLDCDIFMAENGRVGDGANRAIGNEDMARMISIDGDDIEAMQNGTMLIRNGHDARTSLRVRYMPDEVFFADSARYDVGVVIRLRYVNNRMGTPVKPEDAKEFVIKVTFECTLLPFPEWTCIDFGSSAVVARYNNNNIELHKQKKALNGNKTDDDEKEDIFLTSEILFRSVGDDATRTQESRTQESNLSIEQESHNKLAVLLSPTRAMIKQNYQRQIPCLKLLAGNRQLPHVTDYETFTYMRVDNQGQLGRVSIKEANERKERYSLGLVSTLFNETYNILFRHYLCKEVPDLRRVNKLVLTYPNTYTPEHLRMLRTIASGSLPALNQDYPVFVSESDAVAAFYMDKWNDYNPGGNIFDDENILVFDMGAGTLDLTYLTKSNVPSKYHLLEIKGKLGIAKAGNYLDFVLAEIVSPTLAKTTRPSGANADAVAHMRLDLKNFVKNELKPLLSERNRNMSLTFAKGKADEVTVKIGDVLDHNLFKKFIKEVTEDIIGRMTSLWGESGWLPIDTVILSGRSCRLEPLHVGLQQALIKNRNQQVKFISLDTPKFPDRQKTAVAEGAVVLASKYSGKGSNVRIDSRRLYASYGVAYRKVGGEWEYRELVNHRDMPRLADEGAKRFGTHTLTGLNSVSEISLIQTYLTERETLKALNAGDESYVAQMIEINLDAFTDKSAMEMSVELGRDNTITMYVNGRPMKGLPPKGVNLESEETKRGIWPVTL